MDNDNNTKTLMLTENILSGTSPQSIAIFAVDFSDLHDKGFKRGCEAISGNFPVVYQTQKRVFHQDIQTSRSGLKKNRCCRVFVLFSFKPTPIWLLKPFIIIGEIQSRRLQNFMLIKDRAS